MAAFTENIPKSTRLSSIITSPQGARKTPKVILTRTAKAKMITHETNEDFAKYCADHGKYYESRIYKNHYHVRCLGKELIVTIKNGDIIVITFHDKCNDDAVGKECKNLYREGVPKEELTWIRGSRTQPASPIMRAKSASPKSSVMSHHPNSFFQTRCRTASPLTTHR